MQKRLHFVTPVIESAPLKRLSGQDIYLKMDNVQPAGSFKIRGLGFLAQELIGQGKTHLVCSSGGNAGYSVAFAARKLGVQCTVFVPTTTRQIFIDCIQGEGAKVVVAGNAWDEAHEAAFAYAQEIQAGYIHPFDHPTIWKGHSTLIDECVTQCPKPEGILVSVGGGGLACGILEGLYRHGWEDVKIFATETEGTASFTASIKAGKVVTLEKLSGVATSLGVKRVTQRIFDWAKIHPIVPITVTDESALNACKQFTVDHRMIVEPACGAALAPIYDKRSEIQDLKSFLVIVCGGVGVDLNPR